LVLGLSRG